MKRRGFIASILALPFLPKVAPVPPDYYRDDDGNLWWKPYGPKASGTVSEIVNTTLRNRAGALATNVTRHNPLLFHLSRKYHG